MNKFFIGVASVLSMAALASAQFGTMTFQVADADWQLLSNTYVPQTNDPIGQIHVNGSLVNTYSTSNGDHCEANGISRSTVAGGARQQQTATAIGVHTCTWQHFGAGTGEVEIQQQATVDGTVTTQNLNCAAAALGYAQASNSLTLPALAVLRASARTTVAGALGDLSAAYGGIAAQVPVVSLGTGTSVDTDFASNDGYACVNYLWVEHKSRAFIKVLSLRTSASPGVAEASGNMVGDCTTYAYLGHCP